MKNIKRDKKRLIQSIYVITGFVLIMLAGILADINHYLSGVILCVNAVVLYFFIVFGIADKNWMDIRAIFTGVWLVTVGLASLRLLDYQEPWETKTWIYLALAYVMFQVGMNIGEAGCNKYLPRIIQKSKKTKRVTFSFHENRLYWICVGVTLMGVISFAVNVYIKGFIPFFSASETAYLDFYTRFNIFSVACTMISGLCYYCIKTQKLSIIKKIILILSITYATFLLPTLIVSRGTFITAALSLVTAIFYLNKKRLAVLIGSVIVVFGIYVAMSMARGYTDAQLTEIFEPSKITVADTSTTQSGKDELDKLNVDESIEENMDESTDESIEENLDEVVDENVSTSENIVTFTLPPKAAFLYSYLTVSHDNFNEAVQNSTKMTYGLRQISPFNVLLRSSLIDQKLNEAESYVVRAHLPTNNLIGGFYYDLHGFGVILFSVFWGIVFGIIQTLYLKTKDPFALWALGNTMTPVVMCFFSSWMEVFSQWMHWGLCLCMWFIVYISRAEKNNRR